MDKVSWDELNGARRPGHEPARAPESSGPSDGPADAFPGFRKKTARVDERHFYRAPRPKGEHFLLAAPKREVVFAAMFFALGTFGVFVQQADIVTQLVLGAPIFEEFWKFGLALLPLAALRIRFDAIRILWAILIGAGFGVLEHYVTYSAEDTIQFAWRTAFHGLSTGLTMTVYQVLGGGRLDGWPLGFAVDPRAVWFSPLLAVIVHYINNSLALVLGVGSFFYAPLLFVMEQISQALIVVLPILMVLVGVVRRPARVAHSRLARWLPKTSRPKRSAGPVAPGPAASALAPQGPARQEEREPPGWVQRR